ncbi:unnamed protein product [Chilo suppressalis]|uniref:DNA-directed DNA polymerase n=1 Tax=Chilo suppressalis TaxID=168631 RepID=A0ABN8BBT7_CHISP|nr:unnamed protein product [Chilo suppressalis]
MSNRSIYCTVCNVSVNSNRFSAHLKSNLHKNNSAIDLSDGIEKICSAFRNRIASYRLSNSDAETGAPADFLRGMRARVLQLLQARQLTLNSIKVNFELFAEFYLRSNGTDKCEIKSFATENIVVHKNFDFNDFFSQVVAIISSKIDEFQERDSGWLFLRNLHLEININKYNPLRASKFIDLPKSLKLKRACINIHNSDNFCFLWSIMAALFPAENNAHRTSSYPHFENVLNIKNMTFPVNFSDIKTFEKNNSNISINVYGLKNKTNIVGPLYRTQNKKKNHINLLFIEKGNLTHYCLIKNLSRLLRSQLTKHHSKIYFCDDCMIFFENASKFNAHVCGGVATILPRRGTLIQFKNYEKMQDMPFVIYADFESLLQMSPELGPSSNCTKTLQKHIPAAFAYYVVCSYDSSLNKYVSYRGEDCVDKFIDYLKGDVLKIFQLYKNTIPMNKLTAEETESYHTTKLCYLCNQMLFDDRVRDHCHLTGRYRGAIHSYCNLKYRLPQFVPVFFHNLSGYDCHLFIRQLAQTSAPGLSFDAMLLKTKVKLQLIEDLEIIRLIQKGIRGELRQKATSTFEQDFFKLLNNSIFGKTLEDPEKRLDVKLVSQWVDSENITKKQLSAEQLIARPNYHSATVFSENFVAVQMKPESIILDKPIYIGFTVLEISKSHMYNFHYSIMKPFYGCNLKLCYTDTDSFLYSIQTNDIYKDLKVRFQSYFDTSNYDDNNSYGIERKNKKVPGLFKDELGGQLIKEFVGLRSKLYCIKTENKEIKKAKGIKKTVVKKLLFEDYNNVLLHNDGLH